MLCVARSHSYCRVSSALTEALVVPADVVALTEYRPPSLGIRQPFTSRILVSGSRHRIRIRLSLFSGFQSLYHWICRNAQEVLQSTAAR